MGKTTKKAKVSWRTLSRQAAAIEKKHGHPTAASKRLRTQASEQRRVEREKAAIKKARLHAKKATPARRKPRKDTLKGLAHLTASEAGSLSGQAMAGINREGSSNWQVKDYGVTENDTANSNVPLTYTHAEHHEAIFKAVEGAVHRSNDNIVCSFIAMYRYGGHAGGEHTPWKVEAETIRALIDVLDRAGYTASGRRHVEKVTDSESRKAV